MCYIGIAIVGVAVHCILSILRYAKISCCIHSIQIRNNMAQAAIISSQFRNSTYEQWSRSYSSDKNNNNNFIRMMNLEEKKKLNFEFLLLLDSNRCAASSNRWFDGRIMISMSHYSSHTHEFAMYTMRHSARASTTFIYRKTLGRCLTSKLDFLYLLTHE